VKTVSSENQTSTTAEPINETPIPSLLTNSGVEVLNAFGKEIIELEAEASIDNWNRREVMRDYGLLHEQLARDKVTIDYHQITDADGMVENPITDSKADRIIDNLARHLTSDHSVEPDMAVSKLVVRVTSEAMMEASRATTDEFELTFISDPAGDARDVTEDKNFDKGLYDQMGFEYRNLNLHSVYETRAKYAEQSDGKLMGWGGPSDTRPRCSTALAQAVRQDVLPDGFGALKWYVVTEDNVTELRSVETDGDAE